MATPIKNDVNVLSNLIQTDTKLQDQFKQDPVQAIKNISVESPIDSDKWIYRIIVIALGTSILAIVIGLIFIIIQGGKLEDKVITIFTAIASGAIGAVAGLLAPSPRT